MKPQFDPQKIRSILVEIPVNSNQAVASFPIGTIEQVRDAVAIISVEAFNTTLMAKSPSGATNAPDAFYKNCTLSLSDKANIEVRRDIPLAKLIRSNGNSTIEKLNMFSPNGTPGVLDPQRSKITCGDTTGLGAGTVVLLEIVYVNP